MIEPLTEREQEVLALLAEGLTNREISQKLALSPETVKWYNKQLYQKLGVGRRGEAVAVGRRYGLLQSDRQQPAAGGVTTTATLPARFNEFIGREQELRELGALLRGKRLLTLTGPGGTGKTRLALELAAHARPAFADGVFFVDLAPVEEMAQVPATIVRGLALHDGGGHAAAEGNGSGVEFLANFLESRQLLLILDNFEHVIGAAPLAGRLLAAAPRLTVLVTSREPLGIYGEQEYRVAPLPLPQAAAAGVDALLENDAVRLFARRAQAVRPSFAVTGENAEIVAAICRRLAGLPLAIELAAVQLKLFTPAALLQRLEDSLATLRHGARDWPDRQQTLRATIDWSYALLDPGERTLFRRLAVFRGGATIEAVEAVCGEGLPASPVDVTLSLVNKSLVEQQEDGEGRVRLAMLETIREYAWEKVLAAGEASALRAGHARYFLGLAEAAADDLRAGPAQYLWIRRIRTDYDNMRAALNWSFGNGREELGAALVGALAHFWFRSGLYDDLRTWSARALTIEQTLPPVLRARVLAAAGLRAWAVHDMETGRRLDKKAMQLYRELGDERNAAWMQIFVAGQSIGRPDRYGQAVRDCQQALAQLREMGDMAGVSQALNILGELSRMAGHDDAARTYYEEALVIARETGDRLREMMQLENLGFLAQRAAHYAEAERFFLASLPLALELDSNFATAYSLAALAGSLVEADPQRAALLLGAGRRIFEELGAVAHTGDQEVFDANEAAVRAKLGEEAYAAALARGRRMSLREAVACARGELL